MKAKFINRWNFNVYKRENYFERQRQASTFFNNLFYLLRIENYNPLIVKGTLKLDEILNKEI